jgi:hypothetical protein
MPAAERWMAALRWPGSLIAALLLLAGALILMLRSHLQPELPVLVAEEPLLPPPQLPACRSSPPVLAVVSLESGAGASNLAFNLAVLAAAQGRVGVSSGRPRPICLLAHGHLASAMGLDSGSLEDLCRRQAGRIGPEVINLTQLHPTGCELLCFEPRGAAGECLPGLLKELREHYDLVVIDAAVGNQRLITLAGELDGVLLLTALRNPTSEEAAGDWAEQVWSRGMQENAAVVINRVRARTAPSRALSAGYLHQAQLPEQDEIPYMEQRGLPWALDLRLPAARQLQQMAGQLWPALFDGDNQRVA